MMRLHDLTITFEVPDDWTGEEVWQEVDDIINEVTDDTPIKAVFCEDD
jgi:hypothetical protein